VAAQQVPGVVLDHRTERTRHAACAHHRCHFIGF
jgi:hypothetical protein